MTVTTASKVTTQRMILVFWRQNFPIDQLFEHKFKFSQILATPPGKFNIPFELTCAAESPHIPKSA